MIAAVDFTGRVSRTTLLETLTERIETKIRSGEYPQGQRLPSEGDLADQYGVSRPLVREALANLRARGYIETRSGTGTFAKQPDALHLAEVLLRQASDNSSRDLTVNDLYGARSAIETAAARAAASEADPADLDELRRLLKEMNDNIDRPVEFTAADIGFHLAVARASGNALLPTLLAPLVGVIVHGALASASQRAAIEAGIRGHTAILERIEAGDPDGAAEAVRLHLLESRDYFPGALPIASLLTFPVAKPG
jgi:GntR family transcriptional regulator, transcriptional repressor for pyruvate dehydrogenase complex